MKTLKVLFIVTMMSLAMGQFNFAQTVPDSLKQQYINELTDSAKAFNAIKIIATYKIVEAIPKIIENIWNESPYEQIMFLQALQYLGSDRTKDLVYQYLSRVDQYDLEKTGLRADDLKASATTILFKLGDYSKRQLVYDHYYRVRPEVYQNLLFSLIEIFENYLSDKEIVSVILKQIAEENNGSDRRLLALNYLYKYYGDNLIPYIIERFENDSANSDIILGDLLYENRCVAVHNFLQKYVLANLVYRGNPASVLIRNWGTPTDLMIVRKAQEVVIDDMDKGHLEWATNEDPFVLEHIQVISSVIQLTDSLISYHSQCSSFNWLGNSSFSEQLKPYLLDTKTKLISGDSLGAAIKIKQYQSAVFQARKDSLTDRFVTEDGYKFLYYYPKYILERLPKLPTTKLEDSRGNLLNNGSLQYYEGSWKDAINNNDGTFTVPTTLKTVSLRMNYAYSSQIKNNVAVGTDTVVFQTVNTQVKLQNSFGAAIDTGNVQYYTGAWREFGSTSNGIASKELLPGNYSFRMNYAFSSKDKAQDIGTNPIVIFQTVPATVQLKNSSGNFIDQGTVQYYSGAWRDFGVTTNGVVVKELLSNNYSFRMNYAFASKDKAQDVGADPIVVFQTVPATVQLKNSQDNLIDQGVVQYYSGAWRDFGETINGAVVKELLPNNYSFRMNYAFATKEKAQDVGANPTVVFQTVPAIVQLKNSLDNLIDQGTVQYYSGAWRDLGVTTNGVVVKELLPNNYSFRMNYAFASKDKAQDIGVNPMVVFQTVNTVVQLKNSLDNFIDQGVVQYYSGAWRNFGSTANGIATLELLPNNYSFRMTYEFISNNKAQDVGVNNTVSFSTVLCRINVKNAQSQPVDNARISYYSGAWRVIGNTVNGTITKELLPSNLQFRLNYGTTQQDKTQNILTNNVVEFGL